MWFSPMRSIPRIDDRAGMTRHRTSILHLATGVGLAVGAAAGALVSTASPAVAGPKPTACESNVCLVIVNDLADSDGDGYTDSDEKAYGTDPMDPGSHPPALDVILGVFDGTTPSFWQEHNTELVVIPLVAPDGRHIKTGLGDFMMPTKSNEERLGLTLHQQFGLDVPGFTIDPGQSVIATGLSTPGSKYSLVAAGGSGGGGDTSHFTFGKNGSMSGEILTWDASGNGTRTRVEQINGSDGSLSFVTDEKQVKVGDDGTVEPTGAGSTTTASMTPPKTGAMPDGNTYSTQSTTRTDDSGTTVYSLLVETTTAPDGSSVTTYQETTVNPNGTTTKVEGKIERDKNGEKVSGTSTSTTTTADGTVVDKTTTDDKKEEYSDPDLDQAMGWVTFLTNEDLARVAARLGSTIHTVEGWTPPVIGDGPAPTTSPKGPLVVLIDPESAVMTLSTGAPRFTSAQPEYDPRLSGIVGAITSSGQLPPNTSPYTHGDDVP